MRWISHLIIWDRIANFQWSSLHSAGLWTTWDVGFAHPWESFCTWNEGSNSFNGPVIFIFKLGHYWKNHVWRRRLYADTSVKKNCEHWSCVNSLRTLIGWNRFFNILSQNFFTSSQTHFILNPTREKPESREWKSRQTRFKFGLSPSSSNQGQEIHPSLLSDITNYEAQRCNQHHFDFGFAIENRRNRLDGGNCRR